MVVAGAEDLDGMKAKHPGVFVDFLKDRRRFIELDWSSVYNIDLDVHN